jgi:hypothetical protein
MNSESVRQDVSVAFVTPSYWADFALAESLCHSMDRHFRFPFVHTLVVSRRDGRLFQKLAGPHRRILYAEDVLRPYGFFRIPIPRRIIVPWLGERRYREQWYLPGVGRMSGWTVQQIIKFCASDFCDADLIVMTDSDIEIVRDVGVDSFIRDGRALLHQHGDVRNNPRSPAWRRFAIDLLGLAPEVDRELSYIGNLIVWRRETLLAMKQHIGTVSGEWWVALAQGRDVSEYIIYGTFVRECLGGAAHDLGDHALSYSVWSSDVVDCDHLANWKGSHIAVHLQSTLPLDRRSRQDIIDKITLELAATPAQ